ncbi:MAG: hypothetical protein ACSHW6_02765 [Sulfitobacter geojensis]
MSEEMSQKVQREAESLAAELQELDEVRAMFQVWDHDPDIQEAKSALDRDGVKGLEPYIAKYRVTALSSALTGDMTELVDLVRRGSVLNEDEREFVVDYLLGSIAPVKDKGDLTMRISLAYFWLREVDGWDFEAAVAECQSLFGRGRTTVTDRVSDGKNCVSTQEAIRSYRLLLKLGYLEVANYFKGVDLKSG